MIAVVVLISGGGSRFPRPAKFKTWRPIPSIDPTRSLRGISGAWTAEPIQGSMSFERTCAGRRGYRVGPSEQCCERCETVAETVPHLAVAKADGGPFRLCEKRVSRPIRDVNGTKGVDSQKAVLVIHKTAFPDLFAFQSVAAPFPATGWPHGENGGGRERPPLFAARIGRGGVAQFTFAQHPLGGSLPSQLSLAGRPLQRFLKTCCGPQRHPFPHVARHGPWDRLKSGLPEEIGPQLRPSGPRASVLRRSHSALFNAVLSLSRKGRYRGLTKGDAQCTRFCQEPGARSQEPGARSQEPGARSQEPGARSQEPGALSPARTQLATLLPFPSIALARPPVGVQRRSPATAAVLAFAGAAGRWLCRAWSSCWDWEPKLVRRPLAR